MLGGYLVRTEPLLGQTFGTGTGTGGYLFLKNKKSQEPANTGINAPGP